MSKDTDLLSKEAKKYFLAYLDTYFLARDLENTFTFFCDHMIGFGTGLDENAHNRAEFIALYRRDIEQAPNPVSYEFLDYFSSPVFRDTVVICAIINIKTTVMDQELRLNHLRMSLVLHKSASGWHIAHKHISFPSVEHEGDEAYPLKELEERNVILQRMVDKKTAALKAALEEIAVIANTDKLTGLGNRNFLDEQLKKELERSGRYGNAFSIILLDMDHFKTINDSHGHLAGDNFLRSIAKLLKDGIRNTDTLGRWGGEEFLIVCPETELQSCSLMAEKIRARVAVHDFPTVGRKTVSAGVASYRSGDTYDTLLSRADKALYSSKDSGRNKVSIQK